MKKATIMTFVVLALIGVICGYWHHCVIASISNCVGNAICEQANAMAHITARSVEAVGDVCEAIDAGAELSSINND